MNLVANCKRVQDIEIDKSHDITELSSVIKIGKSNLISTNTSKPLYLKSAYRIQDVCIHKTRIMKYPN